MEESKLEDNNESRPTQHFGTSRVSIKPETKDVKSGLKTREQFKVWYAKPQ